MPRMSIRRAAPALVAAIIGALLGAGCMAVLSARASRLYVLRARMALATEQERQAGSAWRRGDFRAALEHAACGVVVERGPQALDPRRSSWDVAFPLMGLFVSERTHYPVKDRSHVEGLAHARLGAVLERLGSTEAAGREYAEANRLAGEDVEVWRRVAVQVLDRESPTVP